MKLKKWLVAAAVAVGAVSLTATASATPAGTVDYVDVNSVQGVQVLQQGRDLQSPTAGQTVMFGAKLSAASNKTLGTLVFAARDSAGANLDFGHRSNVALTTSQYLLTGSRTFSTAGTYRVWVAFNLNGTWYDLTPEMTVTVGQGTQPPPPSSSVPYGSASGLYTSSELKFSDEFTTAVPNQYNNGVDTSKWGFQSSAEALWCSSPYGTGNPNNKQLEFDRPQNASVANGQLTITAQRGNISACGRTYGWTSSLLTSAPSYAFQYGYIEIRADLPDLRGFWPAFWTWQAAGNNQWTETDVFEYYSDNHNALYLSQHSGAGGGFIYDPPFDPSVGMHVYGADITPSGTKFYVDGVLVYTAPGTSTGLTNILIDNFVFADVPPASTTNTERMYVDYVRAWAK